MRKAFFQMHFAIFLWGFTGVLGRLIQLQEGLLVWYRLLITSGILFLVLFLRKQLQFPSKNELIKICFVGILVTIHWLFFYGAIKYSNVSIAVACLASSALFTSLLEPFFNKEISIRKQINLTEILFGIMAMTGIYVMFAFQKIYGLGILLALTASLLGALFTIFNKRLVVRHSAETVTFFELSSGLIFLSFLMPFYLFVFPAVYVLPTLPDWIYLGVLSFFCTVIPFILSLKALKSVSPFTINLSLNLEPVYGIILAFIIFQENKEINLGFYAGTSIILLAVTLHTLREIRRSRGKKIF